MRVWIEIHTHPNIYNYCMFHPLMRVWIEICFFGIYSTQRTWFHPLMRVWIEIVDKTAKKHIFHVSPSYEGVD